MTPRVLETAGLMATAVCRLFAGHLGRADLDDWPDVSADAPVRLAALVEVAARGAGPRELHGWWCRRLEEAAGVAPAAERWPSLPQDRRVQLALFCLVAGVGVHALEFAERCAPRSRSAAAVDLYSFGDRVARVLAAAARVARDAGAQALEVCACASDAAPAPAVKGPDLCVRCGRPVRGRP